jgi:hypothetical protein
MKRGFLARWVLTVTVAETLGFAVPTVLGITLAQAGAAGTVLYAGAVVAGAGEGALLGLGQWIGFGPVRPVPRGPWVTATAIGAALAWSIGGLLFLLEDISWGSWLTRVGAVLSGLVLLAAIPTLQWLVLRRAVRRCAWWIPATMGAWALALPWTLAPSPVVDETTPAAVLIGVYTAGGLLMAITVALFTGLAAQRLVRGLSP